MQTDRGFVEEIYGSWFTGPLSIWAWLTEGGRQCNTRPKGCFDVGWIYDPVWATIMGVCMGGARGPPPPEQGGHSGCSASCRKGGRQSCGSHLLLHLAAAPPRLLLYCPLASLHTALVARCLSKPGIHSYFLIRSLHLCAAIYETWKCNFIFWK